MTAWLDVVGIGADGFAPLNAAAKEALERAEIIVGGERHHQMTAHLQAERIAWPSPFDMMIETLKAARGKRISMLVTGDPLWYSVGARLLKEIPADQIRFHPQLSAFQWASCRMGWSLADVETLTVHGRKKEQILPFFAPGQRLLILTQNAQTPIEVADMLTERGFGPSRLTVLGHLGGPEESRREGTAAAWSAAPPQGLPDFHLLALEIEAREGAQHLPRIGLPDDVFHHDGKITKRELRVLAVAALAPRRGETLWDIGCGCGSVAIEWMRADRDMVAYGVEPREGRRAMAARNAVELGAPRLELRDGAAPDALTGLPAPDAVFIGGGLSRETVAAAMSALKPFGRLVAHAVTLESEAMLAALQKEHGGALGRISVSRAEPVGPYRGWRSAMPVTQWVWSR
ncbi:MAG: precorrin-6y C5,15-methyltransferase (decarboxylating) subunit CbiE [Neomegalonema sp.]|nr:precorrin-6y C5,15-methyltransferase (decarboxylating) subunit CbiE [Neomegalonema sp.]